MCTLIIGRDVLGAGGILLGANRDEDPARPSDPPGILVERPVVVGGRDRVAGGTWLAVRDGQAAVAILNRHDSRPSGDARRSRGLLALDVASARPESHGSSADALGQAARAALEDALARGRYAAFTLVFAAPEVCWVASSETRGEEPEPIRAGWHVLTHGDLDDASEPRTVHLLRSLRDFRPGTLARAEARLMELLRSHAGDGKPAVCIHAGRMQTVSSSLLWLDRNGARYLHAEGRPCETDFVDQGALLERAGG
jgi:uncharacterized protein with NRDE domain